MHAGKGRGCRAVLSVLPWCCDGFGDEGSTASNRCLPLGNAGPAIREVMSEQDGWVDGWVVGRLAALG